MKKLLCIICTLMLTGICAHAADWQFYGSARIQTFVEDSDPGTSTGSPNTSYVQYLQNNARIGAFVRASNSITGRFEYGTDVDVRLLYGEWDFGAGSLLVGQAFSPLNINYSNQVWWDDTNLTDMGGVYSSRNPMIQLTFGEFKIALLETDTLVPSSGTSETEVKRPKVEASYRIKGDAWEFKLAGGYSSYHLIYRGNDYKLNSWIAAAGGKVNVGPFLLAGTFWGGQNPGTYTLQNQAYDTPLFDTSSGAVIDCDGYGYTLIAGYTLNDMFYFETGYGETKADIDYGGYVKDRVYSYYIQSRITLAPGVFVIPEVGLVHWGNDRISIDYGETVYYGAKWQINF